MYKLFKKIALLIASLTLCVGSSISFGHASWSTGEGGQDDIADSEEATFNGLAKSAVCFSTTTKKYYETVETGLTATNSGGTLYVLPNANPTITQNCQVKSGATLCLPYSFSETGGTATATYFNSSTHGATNILADGSNDNVNTFRKNRLTIAQGVRLTLNNSSVLNIGGILGGPGQGLAGQTAGDYCEVLMDSNSSIVSNGGNINCYGYIKESSLNNGSYVNMSNATLLVPFVIYDFKGGAATLGICNRTDHTYCPFSIFDFPNIQVKTRINSNAFLKTYAQIYISTNSTYYPTSESDRVLTLIGSTSSNTMFILSSGYIDIKYTPHGLGTSNSFSSADKTQTSIEIHGNCSIGFISITIAVSGISKSINTANYFLPLCYRYKISVKDNSTLSISKNVKFMTGSSLQVEDGSSINIDSSVILYRSFIDQQPISGYPKINTPASIINNGVINVNQGAGLGGLIDTGNTTGKINYSSNITQVTSSENNGSNPSGMSALYSSSGYVDITESGSIYLSDGVENAELTDIASNYYVSIGNPGGSPEFCWKIDNNSRPHNLVSVSISPSSGSSDANKQKTYSLSAVLNPSDANDVASYHWEITQNSNYGSLSSTSGSSTTLTTNANSSDSDVIVEVTLTVTTTGGTTIHNTGNYTCTKKSSCLHPNTIITMSDGTQKAVRDIQQGDMVLVFNHETGQLDVTPITFNDHDEATLMNVIYCNFSNGKTVGVIYEHGFFDLDTMRYEYIREDNYSKFIGHRFYTEEGGEAILTSVDVRAEYTECYSPTSFFHFDYFVEGMLSMPGGITGLFNIFEYGEDLKYDEDSYNHDIETYGLFTYEDLAPLGVTEIMFEAYAGKYLKVALGKGILTEEYLAYLIERYGGFTEDIEP